MAANRASQATGSLQDGHDLRRRNVPSTSPSNGAVIKPVDSDDEKKSRKVCQVSISCLARFVSLLRLVPADV